jgi:hypothetical protein
MGANHQEGLVVKPEGKCGFHVPMLVIVTCLQLQNEW